MLFIVSSSNVPNHAINNHQELAAESYAFQPS